MKNETSIKYFYILPFSSDTKNKPLITILFFLIYLVGVLVNSSVITAICLDVQLHKPMYLFISNLSIVDIFYTSVTVPKLLYMLLSRDHIVSISQCYTQFCIFLGVVTAEDILLFIMAYDRYVAICLPLHYHRILSRRNCILITIGIWAAAIFNCFLYLMISLYKSSCQSYITHHFFCNTRSLTKTTCAATQMVFILTSIELLALAVIPVICTVISYLKIFSVIFKIKSKASRKKSFSTCSSHITVISIYYGTGLIEYLLPSYSEVLDSVFNAMYATIVPMINPIIYSLQNTGIQSALLGLFRGLSCRSNSCRVSP